MDYSMAINEKGIAIANQISVSIHQEEMSIREKLGILTDAAMEKVWETALPPESVTVFRRMEDVSAC